MHIYICLVYLCNYAAWTYCTAPIPRHSHCLIMALKTTLVALHVDATTHCNRFCLHLPPHYSRRWLLVFGTWYSGNEHSLVSLLPNLTLSTPPFLCNSCWYLVFGNWETTTIWYRFSAGIFFPCYGCWFLVFGIQQRRNIGIAPPSPTRAPQFPYNGCWYWYLVFGLSSLLERCWSEAPYRLGG